jgi:hypothetical protein
MREEGERIKRQLDQEKAAVEMANRERRDIIVEARAGVKVAVEKVLPAPAKRLSAGSDGSKPPSSNELHQEASFQRTLLVKQH